MADSPHCKRTPPSPLLERELPSTIILRWHSFGTRCRRCSRHLTMASCITGSTVSLYAHLILSGSTISAIRRSYASSTLSIPGPHSSINFVKLLKEAVWVIPTCPGRVLVRSKSLTFISSGPNPTHPASENSPSTIRAGRQTFTAILISGKPAIVFPVAPVPPSHSALETRPATFSTRYRPSEPRPRQKLH